MSKTINPLLKVHLLSGFFSFPSFGDVINHAKIDSLLTFNGFNTEFIGGLVKIKARNFANIHCT